MRTREALTLRNKAVRTAKKMGHNPTMVVHTGAMELWACTNQGCNVVMDCWDDPAVYNGTMPKVKCKGQPSTWHNATAQPPAPHKKIFIALSFCGLFFLLWFIASQIPR